MVDFRGEGDDYAPPSPDEIFENTPGWLGLGNCDELLSTLKDNWNKQEWTQNIQPLCNIVFSMILCLTKCLGQI